MSLLEAALAWAENGVPVFPTNRRKVPCTENGHLDASVDPKTITAMFTAAGSSAHGIGARMGKDAGLFAIDVDLYKSGEAGESAKAFVRDLKERGLLPATRTHATVSGGVHYIYASEEIWPNTKPVKGVEVKGEGGYIIVPPTPGYAVTSEGVVAAPEGLINELVAKKAKNSASTIDQLKQNILSGDDFHDSLALLSAKLSGAGHAPEFVQKTLMDTLSASVASHPAHPRHDRWQSLLGNQSRELSRIVASSNAKFNPNAATDKLREAAQAAGFNFRMYAPPGAELPPTAQNFGVPAVIPPAYDGTWPFEEDRGYFGHVALPVLEQKFILHPVLSENEVTLISAEPKAGKTLLAETLAMHIAAGFDLGALRVFERRPVIYFALESQVAIRKRLEAWKRFHDPNGTILTEATFQMYVREAPANLMDEVVRKTLASKIAAADKWYQDNGAAPVGAVVIDTLTKAMPGGDQNSVEDTSALFEFVNDIRHHGVTAAIIFIHHNTKSGGAPRGSSNIQAEPDTLLTLAKDEVTGQLLLKIAMARSIEDTEVYPFSIQGVELGVTTQGYTINAPVLIADSMLKSEADKAQILREKLASANITNTYHRAIKTLGLGNHSKKDIHAHFKKALAHTDFYRTYDDVKANHHKFELLLRNLIPDTGLVIDDEYVVSAQYRYDMSAKAKRIISVNIKKLATAMTA